MSKGIGSWLERHNRYAKLEAQARLSTPVNWRNVFSAHGSRRNQALKPIVSRLPGWPLMRFVFTYIFRLGFLERRPGFVYCANLAYYEFLIRIKMREERERLSRLRGSRTDPEFAGAPNRSPSANAVIRG